MEELMIKQTNNTDIVKVLSTVINIINDFTKEYPMIKIAFKGSCETRNALCQRILKTYFKIFEQEFVITVLEKSEPFLEKIFDPEFKGIYAVFFVKRKT